MPVKLLRSFPRNGSKFPCLNKRPSLIYYDWGFLARAQFENEEKNEIKLMSEKEDELSRHSVSNKSAISTGSSKS